MSAKVILQRGFKANAEKIAGDYRNILGKNPWDPLCAFELAKHLEIFIYSATEFIKDAKSIQSLSTPGKDGSGWSALTMTTEKNNRIIIHNTFHTSARQQSNIMHELSHIICGHKVEDNRLLNLPIGMRNYNALHEEEANCLGSTIQLPRSALTWAKNKNMNDDSIASYFNASIEMVKYRLRMSGILKQYSHFKKNF
ncbi:ImmA/IrrE family metallo-endopeptidase [Chryseobacterium arthrosphaerae]|uniref:ImmA/IrrE family metallo-endopeptidase n=1 Tax=Chryseobacterium arthrosphaerae TaxID=651561 RepID=UPI001BAEFF1F|nr:ImmA/IrrE family metallo-endopeptidase [Chryseobacterium arthrosphaerae]QUY55455.1 ImmA/IrrE family metallo-endopeptidase [Chryseobacterium arthrosphaerae]